MNINGNASPEVNRELLRASDGPAIDVSVVLGTLNRLELLKASIKSVRQNGFSGNIEIVAVDGGSTDGTVQWLARQRDILTIVQPNYKITEPGRHPRLAHRWGEFMNIGFRACSGKWILMISDDLILSVGSIARGFEMLEESREKGQAVGAGAFFYRDYPRDLRYHVKLLPGGVVLVNHGFFLKSALEDIHYIDERSFEFYAADGDLCMRLTAAGYRIAPLNDCFAEHLAHRPNFRRRLGKATPKGVTDFALFEQRWGKLKANEVIYSDSQSTDRAYQHFWRIAPMQCVLSAAVRYWSRSKQGERTSPV